MGTRIQLKNVQINWPQLLTPTTSQNFPNNPPTYSVVVILDPKKHAVQIDEVQKAMDAEAQDTFKGKAFTYPPSWEIGDNGCYNLRASAQKTSVPQVVDEAVQVVYDEAKFYSGCYTNVVIDIYATTKYGNKISAGLLMIQFVADGDRLDNRPKAEDLFKPIDFNTNSLLD